MTIKSQERIDMAVELAWRILCLDFPNEVSHGEGGAGQLGYWQLRQMMIGANDVLKLSRKEIARASEKSSRRFTQSFLIAPYSLHRMRLNKPEYEIRIINAIESL